MTGWIVASATAASLTALGAGTYAATQGPSWAGDVGIESWAPELAQKMTMFASGGQIGVQIRELNADELKNGKAAGVVVEEVEPDSPAAKAGFKAGDVVSEFDGERVRSARQFMRLVQETSVGRSVAAVVTRDGQRVTLNVEPEAKGSVTQWNRSGDFVYSLPLPKASPPMVLKRDGFPPSFDDLIAGASQLGVQVNDLPPQLSEYFGVKEGVLVTTVRADSNASRAGVKAGDVITSLNGGAVSSAADLRRRTQRLEAGDEFTIAVVRDKKPLTLKGKLERRTQGRAMVRT